MVDLADERSAALKDLTPEARSAAIARATSIVEDEGAPGLCARAGLHGGIHPATNDMAGISRLPNGAAAYARAMENFTSTKLTADEIHTIGLREVARIEAEMDKHLTSLGLSEGGIEARMKQLDARFQPKGEGDPRPAHHRQLQRDGDGRRTSQRAAVQPQAARAGGRAPRAADDEAVGRRPLQPAGAGRQPPGHVLGADARAEVPDDPHAQPVLPRGGAGPPLPARDPAGDGGSPKFRSQRIFSGGSAHSEGWALYTERLAVEQGWYEGDVPGLLGALGSELFRARRLVADTGLHTKGWTRQQAIDYGMGVRKPSATSSGPARPMPT